MDQYVTQVLFNNVDQAKLVNIVEAVRSECAISLVIPYGYLM